jgi:hypothetical protein
LKPPFFACSLFESKQGKMSADMCIKQLLVMLFLPGKQTEKGILEQFLSSLIGIFE